MTTAMMERQEKVGVKTFISRKCLINRLTWLKTSTEVVKFKLGLILDRIDSISERIHLRPILDSRSLKLIRAKIKTFRKDFFIKRGRSTLMSA